jgi:enoyl reductase-like protein
MEKLLKSTGKYDHHLLCISENTNASEVKEKISNKIEELQDEDIDEIFFYYTRHGDFYQNEFYYVLSDFNSEKRKQTSLENSEIDNWFRSLEPNMIIKVVDACHSGVMYVKENDQNLNIYLKKSTQLFDKVI